MLCQYCGAKNSERSRICVNCQRLFPESHSATHTDLPKWSKAPVNPSLDLPDQSPINPDLPEFYKAFIGDNNRQYYLIRFSLFDNTHKFLLTFNLNGLVFTPYWMVYRKLWLPLLLYQILLAPWVVWIDVNSFPLIVKLLLNVVFTILPFVFGLFANNIYYLSCQKYLRKAQKKFNSPRDQLNYLRDLGGVSSFGIQIIGYLLVFGLDLFRLAYFLPYLDQLRT